MFRCSGNAARWIVGRLPGDRECKNNDSGSFLVFVLLKTGKESVVIGVIHAASDGVDSVGSMMVFVNGTWSSSSSMEQTDTILDCRRVVGVLGSRGETCIG